MPVISCKFRYWVPVVSWMLFIFWMSTDAFSATNTVSAIEPFFRRFIPEMSSRQLDFVHHVIRKFAHVAEYFLLGILILRAFRGGSVQRRTIKIAIVAFFVVILYAATDEFHQLFETTRTGSAIDVCIDATGGFMGLVVNTLWTARSQKSAALSDSTSS